MTNDEQASLSTEWIAVGDLRPHPGNPRLNTLDGDGRTFEEVAKERAQALPSEA